MTRSDARRRAKRNAIVLLFALVTLGSGITNLWSVMGGPGLPQRLRLLLEIFPVEFVHFSRFATLLTGFGLVVSSVNILKRKRRAWWIVIVVSLVSALANFSKGLDYEEATLSLILSLGLLAAGRYFTVRSSTPDWLGGAVRFGIAVVLVFGYGVAGFWYLDRADFGINFHLGAAVAQTTSFLTFDDTLPLVPKTHYGAWFIDSLYWITVLGAVYGFAALFRPALYQFRTLPHERTRAAEIIRLHGRSALDYFKTWPDKSLFFTPSQRTFLAYRVGAQMAVVLADPVGPEEEIEEILTRFTAFCAENDWPLALHQTLPDFLPLYQHLGLRRIKVGDDAIVDLPTFSLDGKSMKKIRHYVNQLEKSGIQTQLLTPPISDETLSRVRRVSDEWLQLSGHRERQFTLGRFEPEYLRSTPIFAAIDGKGEIQAFANITPSFHPGEATIDLMRYRAGAPPGIMDYLFTRLFAHFKEQGFTRFNLGMAPMAGFQEHEQASREERAIHFFLQRLTFLFSFSGLRQYKAKYATFWEPRYTVYKNALDLPRLALSLSRVAEIDD